MCFFNLIPYHSLMREKMHMIFLCFLFQILYFPAHLFNCAHVGTKFKVLWNVSRYLCLNVGFVLPTQNTKIKKSRETLKFKCNRPDPTQSMGGLKIAVQLLVLKIVASLLILSYTISYALCMQQDTIIDDLCISQFKILNNFLLILMYS